MPSVIKKVNISNSIHLHENPLIHIQKIKKNSSRLEDWINGNYTKPPKHTTTSVKNDKPNKDNNLKKGETLLDDIITDANGYYEFLDIESGIYTLQVSFNDYEIYSEGFTIENSSIQKDVTISAEILPQVSSINLYDGDYEIDASWSAINKQTLLGYNEYDKHFLWYNGELSEDQYYFYPQYTSWVKTNSSIISTTSTSYSSEEYNGTYGGMVLPVNIDNNETTSSSSTDIDYLELPSKSKVLASFPLLSSTSAIYIPNSTHEISLHMRFYYTDAVQILQMSNWKVKVSTNGTTWTTAATHILPTGSIPNYNYGYTKSFSMNNYKGQTIYLKTDPTEFPDPSNAFTIENLLVEYSQDGSGFGSATEPTVTTEAVTEITQTSAISGGNVTDNGGATVTARGVCWSTSSNPTIADNHTTDGSGTGTFSSSITSLTANTTYYVRAYATNSEGTAYGNNIEFKSLESGNAPVADFIGSPLSGSTPLLVSFSDLSSNTPSEWQWDFGDGGTSSQKNPQYTFNSPGTYTVHLEVSNDFGSDTKIKTNYIVVSESGSIFSSII